MPEKVIENTAPVEFIRQELNKPLGPREFVLRYLKYLPLIVLSVALSLIVAFIKIRYSIPIYHVQASLLIKNDRSNSGDKDDKLDELFMAQSSINLGNEIEVLKSRPLMQRVVKDLGLQTIYYNKGNVRSTQLYHEAPFKLHILEQEDSTIGFGFSVTVINEQQFTLNKSTTPHNFNEPFKQGNIKCVLFRTTDVSLSFWQSRIFLVSWQPVFNAAESLIANLKIAQINESSTILLLSLETQNIQKGRDVVNAVMAVYDTLIIEDKKRIAINTLNFIDDRLETLKSELGSVEGRLSNFMEKNQTFNTDDQAKAYLERIGTSNDNIVKQQVQLSVLNYLLEYINDSKNNVKPVPTDLGIDEPTLIQLSQAYNIAILEREANLKTTKPNNPLILAYDASLEKMRHNIVEALKNVRQAYLIAGSKLSEQDREVKGQIKALPKKSMQMLNIQRQQKIFEDLYSYLLIKRLETGISSASTASNSRVVEEAIGNETPIKPNRNSLYLTYVLIGLVVPVGLIAIFELLSDKVNNRLEIERATRAPILGEIGHSDDSQTLVVTSSSRRFIAEQFRIIRTNLQYVINKKEKPVILVTSSFSGEGKSFISTNIGAVMALAGKKTVIMEFDIRKPKILAGLDLKRKMGITNFIIGRANFEELAVPVEGIENLFVIPCGPIPPNPAELLLDSRLDELMQKVKENFEVVIMDTAPVGLVSDAINLSKFADCTLFIIRRGHTVRRLLGLIEELYISQRLPSISLLLNDVKMDGGYYGGYYGGYGYYGYGYGQEGGYFEKEGTGKKRKNPLKRVKRWWSRWFS